MRIVVCVVALALAGSGVVAQHHTAGYFSVTWVSNGVALALKTSPTGVVTSMQIGTMSHYQCEMDDANKLVLVADSTSSAIWQIDPNVMAITGTLVTDPAFGTVVRGLDYDHNGDLLVATSGQLYKVSPAGTVSTLGSLPGAWHTAHDVLTGDLLVASSTVLFQLDPNTMQLTTLGTGFSSRYGDLVRDPLTGDIYVPTCCGWLNPAKSLHVLKAGTTVASIYLASIDLAGAYGPNLDRASAASRRLVTGSHVFLSSYPNSGGMWYIDLATATPTRLVKWQQRTIADSTILESRNLHTVRTAAGRYDVRISVPPDGGKGYVLGLTLSGVAPPVPLADGRRIPLVPDALTALTVQNLAAPFVTGTAGFLDAFGRAQAHIDVGGLYSLLKGVRLWMVAATLDSQAPLGIATITDPAVLRFD